MGLSDNSFAATPGRLDQIMALHTGFTRSQMQHWIAQGQVYVNGTPVYKTGHKLKGGEQIQFEAPPLNIHQVLPETVDLKVLYEDAELIVVDKPPGMVTHPTHRIREGTLVNALLGKMSQESQDMPWTEEGYRPGIVHRLDKDTSGVIAVAKTVATHASLADAFKERLCRKVYLAICAGNLERPTEIDAPIGRQPTDPMRMAVGGISAREAQTYVRPLAHARDAWGQSYTLVQCQPKTGRTHQIRVHLSYLKLALLGDAVYGRTGDWIGRQALHAWTLDLPYPNRDQVLHLKASIPQDILSAWQFLGADPLDPGIGPVLENVGKQRLNGG
ncbi:MAG: RluA family pseudouridine synthase [Deinococcaceae bacterium]